MDKYQYMFDYALVSIWEEDWSHVKILLDGIRAIVKPEEIGSYFTNNPNFLNQLVGSIKITRVNKKCSDIYDANSKNELLVQPLQKTFSYNSYVTFQKEMEALYRGDSFFEHETERTTLSGKTVYIYLKVKLPTTEQEYNNVIVIMTDLTEAKTIKNDYLRTKNTFYQAFHNGMTGMALIGMNGNIIEVNQSFCDLTQYKTDEILCKNVSLLFNNIMVKNVFDNKIPNFKTSILLRRKDDHEVWVLLGLSMVVDEVGCPLYFVGQIVDINNEKLNSDIFQKNVEKYQQLLDSTNAVYLILNQEGLITDSSDNFNKLFNYNDNDIKNKPLRALVSTQSIPVFDKSWAAIIKGQTINAVEISLEKGVIFKWFSFNASMFINGCTKIFVLLTDITDKKKQEFQKIIKQEKKRDKLRNNIQSLRDTIEKIKNTR